MWSEKKKARKNLAFSSGGAEEEKKPAPVAPQLMTLETA